MAAVNVNAFKPVEAQLVLSLDDLIKQRREATKQETKATKKPDVTKAANKQKPGKAKNSNAAPLAQKKKQNKKVNAKPATQEVAATTLTPNQRKRLRKKKSKAAAAATGDAKSTGSPTKAQNKNQPKKQQNNNPPKKQQNNTLPNKQQNNNQPKKQQNNNQPKKQQQNNNQPKKQSSNQQPQQSQLKKKNVQIKIQRGNGGAAQKTISPSNNKTKASQNQDKRNVLFNVTLNGGKGLSLGKQRNGKKEHPVKRLLGNHIANKKSNTKGGAGKPKMALKRRGNKKAT